jgi:murein endopeptidase
LLELTPGSLSQVQFIYETYRSSRATVDVSVPGLEQLPADGENYQIVRGGTETHPQGTYAKPETIETLLEIAKNYREISGSKLSVNDLSLPAGGLFDIRDNWQTPHKSHREGIDADINRTNIEGEFTLCEDDLDLKEAIKIVAAGAKFPRLYCEEQGFKHIDF